MASWLAFVRATTAKPILRNVAAITAASFSGLANAGTLLYAEFPITSATRRSPGCLLPATSGTAMVLVGMAVDEVALIGG